MLVEGFVGPQVFFFFFRFWFGLVWFGLERQQKEKENKERSKKKTKKQEQKKKEKKRYQCSLGKDDTGTCASFGLSIPSLPTPQERNRGTMVAQKKRRKG